MKNSDKVSHVCITVGGSRNGVKTMGNKMHFTVDRVRLSKQLNKLNFSSVHWIDLPSPMTKAEAVQYIRTSNDASLTNPAYQNAINKATVRLVSPV